MSAIHQSAPLDLSPTINTRLLKLELGSSAITPSFIISVRLHVTSLVDAPPYTAISYVWGEPSPTKQILLNGEAFTIRENLWNLLNRLRSERHQGYLWIDALSIDQTSNQEKNHQVAIMGSIYMQAQTTICWLGVTAADIADGIQVLTRLYERRQYSLDYPLDTQLRNNPVFLYVIENPYWTRKWILQEYVLSANAEFWCNNWTIQAEILRWSIFHIRRWAGFPQASTVAWDMMSLGVNARAGHPMVELLRRTHFCECVDPRDRIYALLSLLNPDEREAWSISPNYAISMESLFEELVSAYPKSSYTIPLGSWKEELRELLFREGAVAGISPWI